MGTVMGHNFSVAWMAVWHEKKVKENILGLPVKPSGWVAPHKAWVQIQAKACYSLFLP